MYTPEYRYMGYTFRPTDTMTEVFVLDRSRNYTKKSVPLYEIDGLKERGERPFLTSIKGCKEYIKETKGEC